MEELVVDRADALLTTTSSQSGLGDIEVHAAVFRPARTTGPGFAGPEQQGSREGGEHRTFPNPG